jgi:hypothetical protein
MKSLGQFLHQIAPIPVVFGMIYMIGAAHIVAQNGAGGQSIHVSDWIAGFATGAVLTCLGVRFMPHALRNAASSQPCETAQSAS